ncbi:hypothetical protein PRIPAC_94908 [Pristionchus pacificus]|uniref:Cytochrome P450 n=1 Tax=Pristionchus pacificus TaxID=54126 RepID=A0A2A6BB63_PRIPA|nr:hypothetical protein PRIPAC_94908 [Pristionchus pacificus]|eukprot:PDM63104.1 cytochrome P450 [Pristionchus pacificus]
MKLILHLLIFGVLFVFTVESRAKRTTTPPVDDAEPDVEDVEIAPELDEEEPSPKARKAPKPVAEVNQPINSKTCPMRELTAKELKSVKKTKEYTCYKLGEAIKEKAEDNQRPTAKEAEINEVCLKEYTEAYLKSEYGGWINKAMRFFKRTWKKIRGRVNKIPCAHDDKILDFALGLRNGKFYLRQSQYWKRRGVPGPYSPPFYGNLKDIHNFQIPFLLKIYEWTKEFGKVYGYREGCKNVLVISDIDMINEVFVKQFDTFYARKASSHPFAQDPDKNPRVHLFESRGARWKRIRALTSPSFTSKSLKKILPIIEDSAVKLVDLMGERHAGGESFNAHEFFAEFTLDAICRLVLGKKESTLFNNPRLAILKIIFLQNLYKPLTNFAHGAPPVGRAVQKLYNRFNMIINKSIFDEIAETVIERVQQRETGGHPSEPADYIDLLLDHAAEFQLQNSGEFSTHDSVTKVMTVDEVIAQAVVFLQAGYDTTANALSYTTWMLSRHPDIMKRCQEEVDDVCTNSSISYEDCQNLRYLDAVCKETLRVFPFGTFSLGRTCMKDTTVCGYHIEEGTIVQADPHAVNLSKELWGEDAEEFRPERWLEADNQRAATAFLSFGAGPRICIGMRLAYTEEKLLLAHMLRKFDIIADEKVSNLKLIGTLTMIPEEVPVKIRARA